MTYSPDYLTRVSPSSGGWSNYEVRYFSHGNNSPDYDNGNSTGAAYAIYDRYHTAANGGARTGSTDDKFIKVGIGSTDFNNWSDHGSGSPTDVTTSATGLVSLIYPGVGSVYDFQKPTTADWISTGPTVTSITVANQNSATRSFTVAHTGTLSASHIDYTINGVDITSLNSPNTPITNIQTTSTGSTFDSYTVTSSTTGVHIITIESKTLTFYVPQSGTQRILTSNVTELTSNNIIITFPTTENGWLQHVNNKYSEVFIYNESVVYYGYTGTSEIEPNQIEYLRIGTNYISSSDSTQRGFYWKLETWNFAVSPKSSSLSIGFIDPVALNESTASPNTNITVSQYFLDNSIFNWNFATIAQDATTSNGGGKPDRYPLIMTNLFNRNRSIYSIGMTHKDTWDLFL